MNVHQLVRKPKLKTSTEEASAVCSRHGQLNSNKEQFNNSNEQSNVTCTRKNKNKNCQAEKCDMQAVKFQMDMWLKQPAIKSSNKKLIGLSKDKNCQSMKKNKSKYDDLDSLFTVIKCSDKKCQENIHMQPVRPQPDVQLPKPAIRRLCSDKNCQSTRCYKKRNHDKNFQSV